MVSNLASSGVGLHITSTCYVAASGRNVWLVSVGYTPLILNNVGGRENVTDIVTNCAASWVKVLVVYWASGAAASW